MKFGKPSVSFLINQTNQVKDFCPISLVHSFAKQITKILANRLAKRLNAMVSPSQSAFIKGRFIQDNFMLVQQTSKLFHQHNMPRMFFKLDITKAFDSVSWPILIEVMQQMGFGHIWRDIVCGLLPSSTTQVLLNGVPGKLIMHRRGLRQGDPLSPMLFILAMDVLGLLYSKAEGAGLLQQPSRRKRLHRVSMYADDVALFLHPTAIDISTSLDILLLFVMRQAFAIIHRNQMCTLSNAPRRLLTKLGLQPLLADIWVSPCLYINYPGIRLSSL
jgi:hypothetical protein